MRDSHTTFMKEALRQARRGVGWTSPNPAVGAVIVRGGRILASGYHRKAGMDHAEVDALNQLNGTAPGATLYVTLEPCNHQGRTPPCTEAILKSGIEHVVVGVRDANTRVAGGGCELLQQKGVRVDTGVLEEECRQLNEGYFKFVRTGRPFVMLKSAMTLDGWTATAAGHSKWVTNERSRRYVHRLRSQVDAVMVGVGTVIADDPLLTARLSRGGGRNPLRVVVDTRLRIPLRAKVLAERPGAGTMLAVGPDAPHEAVGGLKQQGIQIVQCPVKSGRIDLKALMGVMGELNVTSVLVEGGAAITGSLIRERLVDKFYLFKAPKLLGGNDGVSMASGPGSKTMDECVGLTRVAVKRFAGDLLVVGYPHWN